MEMSISRWLVIIMQLHNLTLFIATSTIEQAIRDKTPLGEKVGLSNVFILSFCACQG